MKRIWLTMVIGIAVASVAAIAYATGEGTAKGLPSTVGNGNPHGCVLRRQLLQHQGINDRMFLRLTLHVTDDACDAPNFDLSFSGTSYIGLVRTDSSGAFEICSSEKLTVKSERIASQSFAYSKPPCGAGVYYAVSCSEALTTKRPSNGSKGATREDCSNILNWTFSGPHPIF